MCKGIVIAGTHSGVGKTNISIGIMAALRMKGLNVQAFKAGPDFIDPGLHEIITDRPSRNLDIWMCGTDYIVECFSKNAEDADIAVVEGVMGLFDGGVASTAEVAKTLGLPVALVVDAHSMAESAAALVKGFESFDQRVNIAGVIFNKVAGESHLRMLSDAIKKYTNVQVFGYLPKQIEFSIPERHLGLLTKEESPISNDVLTALAKAVTENINIELLLKLAVPIASNPMKNQSSIHNYGPQIKVAIAKDRAFCFYYEDNLDLLREAGGQIVSFSPLSDTKIPDNIDAVYIGGGYPELYAHDLSRNESMLKAIHTWALAGKPLYAECGGLMYLSKGIYDFDGNFYKMAEIFPFKTAMKKGRVSLGYRKVRLLSDSILGRQGDVLRGHEFHYSEIKTNELLPKTIYQTNGQSGKEFLEGYSIKNSLASYVHIHFGSNPDIVKNFVKFVREI